MKLKRILALVITVVMMSSIVGCNNNKNQGLVTEYDVEDYVDNAIVVCKNDLLYGLLDNNGNIIIPIEYDSLWFINRDEYLAGFHDDLYVMAESEYSSKIFNIKGDELTDSGFNFIKYSFLPEDSNENTPSFYQGDKTHRIYSLYNLQSEFIRNIELPDYAVELDFISDKCYLYRPLLDSTYIADFEGNIITDLGHCEYLTHGFDGEYYVVAACDLYTQDDAKVYYINEYGEVVKKENAGSWRIAQNVPHEMYDITKYNLYESNSTWKIEDINGNPLYMDRYIDKISIGGDNHCVVLTNEDGNGCLFNYAGELCIDFDGLVIEDGVCYLSTKKGKEEIDRIYEGRDSIAVVINEPDATKVYFYESISK